MRQGARSAFARALLLLSAVCGSSIMFAGRARPRGRVVRNFTAAPRPWASYTRAASPGLFSDFLSAVSSTAWSGPVLRKLWRAGRAPFDFFTGMAASGVLNARACRGRDARRNPRAWGRAA